MNSSIVLVFVLHILGTHGHCNTICRNWIKIVDSLIVVERVPVDNCYCVRTHQCYQEDISEQWECRNNALVCCRRPVRRPKTKFTTPRPNPWNTTKRPSQRPEASAQSPPRTSTKTPARNPSSQPTTQVPSQISTHISITNPPTQIRPASSQPKPQDTASQGSSPTETECTCLPLSDCYDEGFESNSQHKKGSCTNPDEVCCLGFVKPSTALQPQLPKPSQIPIQSQPVDSTPRPQPPSPTRAPPPADKECICTPFFKCYDEETSSNLTNIVNDRTNRCSDPNDICCYNLVKINAKPTKDLSKSSKVCSGSCVNIQECPYFSNKLNEAHGGNSEVIQELRSAVCSNTNGNLRVCCPPPPSCLFPFIYKSVTYAECTTKDDPNGELWCSTQTDDRNNHVKDQYRLCTKDDALVPAGN